MLTLRLQKATMAIPDSVPEAYCGAMLENATRVRRLCEGAQSELVWRDERTTDEVTHMIATRTSGAQRVLLLVACAHTSHGCCRRQRRAVALCEEHRRHARAARGRRAAPQAHRGPTALGSVRALGCVIRCDWRESVPAAVCARSRVRDRSGVTLRTQAALSISTPTTSACGS
jgi:hypothetical protein